ncbi:MAG: winged helix-turn-helix domain-containing protein [Firmicutes bacterium]|nr:winged helix-turn-helix domain-containing protein [Bacillota bacterium]
MLQLGERQGRPTPEGTKLQLELNRTELANLVGLRQETFSRCLAEFVRQGWIKTQGYKTIFIRDVEALRQLGER